MVNEWSDDDEMDELEKAMAKRGKPLRKRRLWTEEEHRLFLMGLNKYGEEGHWRSISRYYVVAKTPAQVASHALKFFRRRNITYPPPPPPPPPGRN